ncbi:MAG: 23S rRNA (pseudouridine(1915)-N(3))-methyltransferase RlmH [Peptococcaceae bacterium]|nr:23S rRNA (pseudouridine(1915)-N(3))-methyltransferase RlmH [Peptococcaceae bacterium]
MYITLLCVGKIKEKYWQDAIAEYAKRLRSYHQFQIITVADEKDPAQESDKALAQLKEREGERLLKHIRDDDYVVALEISGKAYDTLALADWLQRLDAQGHSHLVFVIGGSYGLADSVCARSNAALSFSKLTFPHQLMRVIFCEQLYRTARINSGQKYHK